MRRRGALVVVVAGVVWAPAAALAAVPLTIGAYYYPWYGADGAQWDRGYVRARLDRPQRPALGEYDSRDAAVIAQHYAWAQQYGVGVFFCSWMGPGGYDDVTIRDHLLVSPARGPTRIALLYESLQRLGLGADDRIQLDERAVARLVADFDYLARTYFRDPGYYRIDGRPVVVLYASRIYRGAVQDAVDAIRTHLRDLYGIDPYLIGDEVDADTGPDAERIARFDAITGYTPYSRKQAAGWPSETGYLESVDRRARSFRRVASIQGVRFVPAVLPGFNDHGVRPGDAHYALPRELSLSSPPGSLFARSLDLAGRLVDRDLPLLLVTSWNEWQEDSQIEPTANGAESAAPADATEGYAYRPYGFAALEQLARFKRSWELQDQRKSRKRSSRLSK
jgi:hypothetical protein